MIRHHVFLSVLLFILGMPAPGVAESPVKSTLPSEQDAHSLLSALVSYTDLRIRSVQRSLEILASTTEARSGDWSEMKELLRGYQVSDEGLIIWYLRPDGSYYTVDEGLMDKKLSDRSYFPNLMAGMKITGALVISKATGQRSAVIAVPIKIGGKVVGAIGASLFLDRLSEQISGILDLRPGVAFFALASNGLTTLHRNTDRHFLDPRELGSETLKRAANEILSGISGKTTYEFDNVTKSVIYMTSAVTEWRFAIVFVPSP